MKEEHIPIVMGIVWLSLLGFITLINIFPLTESGITILKNMLPVLILIIICSVGRWYVLHTDMEVSTS